MNTSIFRHVNEAARSFAGLFERQQRTRRSCRPSLLRPGWLRNLRIESLESRKLLTATISLSAQGDVVITDAGAANNTIQISYAGNGNYTITDSGDDVQSSVPGSVTVSANAQTVPVGSNAS